MRAFVHPEEMKRIDAETIQRGSLTSFDLMSRVAGEMAEKIRSEIRKDNKLLVLCGPGNNGGDAYLVAEQLRQDGYTVVVEVLEPPRSEDCQRARKLCQALVSETEVFDRFDVLVDGVFGSGGSDQLSERIQKRFRKLNESKAKRIALDVPSGVNSATGEAHIDAFKADLTLCVAYPKWGFIFEDLASCLGKILYVGQGFAPALSPKAYALEETDFSIDREKASKHKSGHCAVIAGSLETPGAAFLAAEAAHRTGVGYVSLFSPRQESFSIELKEASFLFRQKWEWDELRNYQSLVIGPGGCPEDIRALEKIDRPQVVDADALEAAYRLKPYSKRIFTPHPGEAARLLGEEIKKDRFFALDRLVSSAHQSFYLKGAPGLLRFPDDPTYYVNLSINPAMARAGSGDVLAGIMGGFLAQDPDFKKCIFSSLVFQSTISELLRGKRAAISSDQLELFSEAFSKLQ